MKKNMHIENLKNHIDINLLHDQKNALSCIS